MQNLFAVDFRIICVNHINKGLRYEKALLKVLGFTSRKFAFGKVRSWYTVLFS